MGYWTREGVTIRKCGRYGGLVYWTREGVTTRKCGGYGGLLDVGGSNDKEVWGIWWATGRGRE